MAENKNREERLDQANSGTQKVKSSTVKQKDDLKTIDSTGKKAGMVKPGRDAQAANPCIWMQAGVVDFKACNNYYDCTSCKYDLGMRQRVEKGKQTSWQDAMRKRSGLDRLCRHSLTNRVVRRPCAYNYQCGSCDFDQFFEDQFSVHAVIRPVNMLSVNGFEIPQGYYFHKGHTWVRIEEGASARIGMDDFALRLLGPLDAIRAPLIGKRIKRNNADIRVARGENQADILSPINGVVTACNVSLMEKGSTANDDPYSNGWVLMVQPDNLREDLGELMINRESEDFIRDETDELYRIVEEVSGPLAADGGSFSRDIFGNMPELEWARLTRVFLHT